MHILGCKLDSISAVYIFGCKLVLQRNPKLAISPQHKQAVVRGSIKKGFADAIMTSTKIAQYGIKYYAIMIRTYNILTQMLFQISFLQLGGTYPSFGWGGNSCLYKYGNNQLNLLPNGFVSQRIILPG